MSDGGEWFEQTLQLQRELHDAPTGQVRMFDDGRTIAYRSEGGWAILTPDGRIRDVTSVKVDEFGPLCRWAIIAGGH